ncbi:MAG TPA: response regulator, partial [Pirellulaceae bacterium]|nr:response regulator [Pirellulaceae bacterium]
VGFLERAGHQVVLAENGEVAIRNWEKQTFDVILMDVQMPVMDGLAATTVIRQRESTLGKRTPIIAMTAAAMKGDKERCLAVGMDDYVSKPIAPAALFATIAKYVGESSEYEPEANLTQGFANDQRDVVDFDVALTQVPGGIDVLRDLARIFLMECPKLLKDLRQGLADENVEATQRAAHTLKGAARILAASRLTEISSEFEVLAKERQVETIRSRLHEIEAAVDEACKLIKAWRG